MRWLVALTVSVLVFAGCSQPGTKGTSSDSSSSTPPASAPAPTSTSSSTTTTAPPTSPSTSTTAKPASSTSTATSSSTSTTPAPAAGVHIQDIESDAAGSPDDASNAALEWVEICNDGAARDLTGWKLKDSASNTYTFPAFSLASAGCVKVRTGSGTDTATDLYWGRGTHVWNQDHDTAYLNDSTGTQADSKSY